MAPALGVSRDGLTLRLMAGLGLLPLFGAGILAGAWTYHERFRSVCGLPMKLLLGLTLVGGLIGSVHPGGEYSVTAGVNRVPAEWKP